MPLRSQPAKCAVVDRQAVWDRMNTHGISQNEVARRAGLSSAYLSQIMSGKSKPSPGVLKRLHWVLFQRSQSEERVMPAEVKVLGWKKGKRSGMVVRGAGGPGRGSKDGGGAVRVGGRVPFRCESGLRVSRGVRRPGPGVGDSRCRKGLLRHVDAIGGRLSGNGHLRAGRGPTLGTRRWPTLPDQQELVGVGVRAQSEGEDTNPTRGVLPLPPMYVAFFCCRKSGW